MGGCRIESRAGLDHLRSRLSANLSLRLWQKFVRNQVRGGTGHPPVAQSVAKYCSPACVLVVFLCRLSSEQYSIQQLNLFSLTAPTNRSGMLDDFVVVTINRPGPLCVRLKPDPRGVVIVHNFDDAPDDPRTSCPRLGPLESVGTVMPGDALVRVVCGVDMFIVAAIAFAVVSLVLVPMAMGGGTDAKFRDQVASAHCLVVCACSRIYFDCCQTFSPAACSCCCAGLSESGSASGTPIFGVREVHSRSILK